ncbi:hypothetical protein [Nostoc sp. FACHB-110]|uniref:hypothetical protein n=1 Tax=Nostoc sp. FACHB-110 TaxID=2692834 RepID=UPI001682D882|nr:hypothetical protein [Nostoc sp. FACHB-110]MBD2438507.1 hypothetical protein [Nostoc sp. FACHB-110]
MKDSCRSAPTTWNGHLSATRPERKRSRSSMDGNRVFGCGAKRSRQTNQHIYIELIEEA